MDLVNLLFGFQGRIGRGQYWLVVGIWVGVALVIFVLLTVATVFLAVSLPQSFYYVLAAVVYIPMLVAMVAAGIKRLHDRNKSAWWLLAFYLLPMVLPWFGLIFSGDFGADFESLPMPVIALYYIRVAIVIWAAVELGCLRGTIGGNPFGPDPVAPKPAKH